MKRAFKNQSQSESAFISAEGCRGLCIGTCSFPLRVRHWWLASAGLWANSCLPWCPRDRRRRQPIMRARWPMGGVPAASLANQIPKQVHLMLRDRQNSTRDFLSMYPTAGDNMCTWLQCFYDISIPKHDHLRNTMQYNTSGINALSW